MEPHTSGIWRNEFPSPPRAQPSAGEKHQIPSGSKHPGIPPGRAGSRGDPGKRLHLEAAAAFHAPIFLRGCAQLLLSPLSPQCLFCATTTPSWAELERFSRPESRVRGRKRLEPPHPAPWICPLHGPTFCSPQTLFFLLFFLISLKPSSLEQPRVGNAGSWHSRVLEEPAHPGGGHGGYQRCPGQPLPSRTPLGALGQR